MPYPKQFDHKEAQTMFEEGKTVIKIADRFGVSRQAIYKALRKLPLPEPLDVIVRINEMVKELDHQIEVCKRSRRSKEARLMGEAKDLLIYLRDYKV